MATNNHHREPIKYQSSPRMISSNDRSFNDKQIKTRQQIPHARVVVKQPDESVWDFEHAWSYNICSCCDNMKQCCYAFCCGCCFDYSLFKRSGENACTCLCPGSKFALRSKIRTAFRIQGSLCNDCCIATCCPCCTSIQLTRELHRQGL